MTSRDFCYWLQGYFEVADPESIPEEQVEVIKNHLSMVFVHEIDPSFPEGQQEALTSAHIGKKPAKPKLDTSKIMRC